MYLKLAVILYAVGLALADGQQGTTPTPDYLPPSPTQGYNYNAPNKPFELPPKQYASFNYQALAEPPKNIQPTITSYSQTPVVHSVTYSSKSFAGPVKTVIPAVSYQSTPAPFVFSTPAPFAKAYTPTVTAAPLIASFSTQGKPEYTHFQKSYVQHIPRGNPAPFKTFVQPTVSYATAAPVAVKTFVQPTVYATAAPVVEKTYVQPTFSYAPAAPAFAKSYVQPVSYAASPAVEYTAPAVTYAAAPVVKYASPVTSYVSAPTSYVAQQSFGAPSFTSFVSPSTSYYNNAPAVAYSAPAFASYSSGPFVNAPLSFPSAPQVAFLSYKKKK